MLSVCSSGAATRAQLFMLAGTPTAQRFESYPVTLYTVGPNSKLQRARQVVPAGAGLYAVLDDLEGRLYAAYPHGNPTAAAVIREAEPYTVSTVYFNPNDLTVDSTAFGVESEDGAESHLLCPLLREIEHEGAGPAAVDLVQATEGRASVKNADWALYRWFRYRGSPRRPYGSWGLSTCLHQWGSGVHSGLAARQTLRGRPPGGPHRARARPRG